jgi:hypothetical protein
MNRHPNNDKPTYALLGGRRITGLDLARMFRRLTGRVPTAAQVLASQQGLDAAYARLEAEIAKPKDEKKKGSGVDYGKLTMEALNRHKPCPPAPPPPKEQPEEGEVIGRRLCIRMRNRG